MTRLGDKLLLCKHFFVWTLFLCLLFGFMSVQVKGSASYITSLSAPVVNTFVGEASSQDVSSVESKDPSTPSEQPSSSAGESKDPSSEPGVSSVVSNPGQHGGGNDPSTGDSAGTTLAIFGILLSLAGLITTLLLRRKTDCR